MIECPTPTQRALLVWQCPLGSADRRDRHAVAELLQTVNGIDFHYLGSEKLASPRSEGFTDYPGLPMESTELNRVAEEVLIRRLPPRTRADFGDLAERFGLPRNKNLPSLTLLAYTGARLTGDNFSVCETFDGFEPPFSYVFDVAGFRHYQGRFSELEKGIPLIFEPEPENQHDPNAIRIALTDGTPLGYVNRLQTKAVAERMSIGGISASVFRVNGRSDYPRLFVQADFAAGATKLAA